MSNYIMSNSRSSISNVHSLVFDDRTFGYGESSAGVKSADRLFHSCSILSEGEYIGIQISYNNDCTFTGHVFTSTDVNVSAEDFGWIFKDFAETDISKTDSLYDFFKNRKIYALKPVSHSPISSDQDYERASYSVYNEDKHYDVMEMSNMLIANDGIIQMVSGAGDKGTAAWWMILFSLPKEMPLRMRSAISYVFPDTTISEFNSVSYGSEKAFHIYEASMINDVGDVINCLMQKLSAGKLSDAEDFAEECYIDDDFIEECAEYYADEYESSDNNICSDSTNIEDMGLSVRAYNCLKRAGITNVRELRALSDDELRHIRNLGRKSFEEIKEKLSEYSLPEKSKETKTSSRDYFAELNELIGLSNVKEQIKKIQAFARLNKDMKEIGKDSIPMVLNMEFVGNPGTAKTTVARIVAGIFKEIGILSSDEIVEVGRADLVGKFVGQTAIKVKGVFEKSKGRLLFIDEAYSLVDSWENQYGDEAISTIVQEMENNRDNTIVIFAGYPDKMADFISRNPGLRSRVPFHIEFEDYTAEEMVQIAELEARKRGFTVDSQATVKMCNIFEKARENAESGNGRFCRNMVEEAILNYAERLYGDTVATKEKEFVLNEKDFLLNAIITDKREKIFGFRHAI